MMPYTGKKIRDAFAMHYKSVPIAVYLWRQRKNPRKLVLELLPKRLIHGGVMKVFECVMDVRFTHSALNECAMTEILS